MYFVVEKIPDSGSRVDSYESLFDISNSLEWQDVVSGAYIILSTSGKKYSWDISKNNEKANVYGYSLIEIGENMELASFLEAAFQQRGWPDSIEEIELKPNHQFHPTQKTRG